VRWRFARGAEVLPQLAPDEARLLFASGGDGHSDGTDGRSDVAAPRSLLSAQPGEERR
jgi:hypothetical protein